MALTPKGETLTAALKDNTEATKNLMALRSEAIEAVKSSAAPAAKAVAAKPAETKPAETKAEPAASGVDPKVYEEIAAAIAAWVGGATREEERAARKVFKDNLAAQVAKGDLTTPPAAGGLLD